MNIASIQTQQTPKDNSNINNPVESNPDKFSQILSQEIKSNNEGKVVPKVTENTEETDMDYSELLSGILNLSFVSKFQQDVVVLEGDIVVNNEMEVAVRDTYNINLLLEGMEFAEENFVMMTSTTMEENLIIENDPTMALDIKDYTDSNEGTLSISMEEVLNKSNTIKKSTINKEVTVQDVEKFDGTNPKIESLNNEEAIKEEMPKELGHKEKTDLKLNEDIDFMDNMQIKDQNTVKFEVSSNADGVESFNDNIEKINDTILQLIETTTEGKVDVVKVKLYPEELGTVDVTLKMEGGKLIAKILVDNDYVKGLFTSRVNELNESLVKQNIILEKINIELNYNPNSEQGFNLNGNGSFNQKREHNSRRSFGLYNRESINSSIPESIIHDSGAISILA